MRHVHNRVASFLTGKDPKRIRHPAYKYPLFPATIHPGRAKSRAAGARIHSPVGPPPLATDQEPAPPSASPCLGQLSAAPRFKAQAARYGSTALRIPLPKSADRTTDPWRQHPPSLFELRSDSGPPTGSTMPGPWAEPLDGFAALAMTGATHWGVIEAIGTRQALRALP